MRCKDEGLLRLEFGDFYDFSYCSEAYRSFLAASRLIISLCMYCEAFMRYCCVT